MDSSFLRILLCGLYLTFHFIVYIIQKYNLLNTLLMLFCTEQECVPVLLSDQVELPFQNVVDYTQISIKWPSTRIGKELLDYLESIPGLISGLLYPPSLSPLITSYWFLTDKKIEEMIARGRRVRCLWVYAPDSESCSAFRGILWELEKKVRRFHHSAETFWLHNGSVVNRDLIGFSKWKPPMPLP